MKLTSHRLLLATVALALLAAAAAGGARSARTADPSLTLNVNVSGALEVVLGNGTRIRTASAPGIVIPPGPYLLIVKSDVPDEKDIFHLFHLSGAGVEMSSDLLPCENPREIYTITLRPNSTYVYEDGRHSDLAARRVQHVRLRLELGNGQHRAGPHRRRLRGLGLELGASSAARPSAPRSPAPSPRSGLTLTKKGKNVSLLEAGRYKIAVDDRTSKRGFTIAKVQKSPVVVTRPSFVGKHTVTLNLTAGRWMLSSGSGKPQYFTVVS